MTKSIILIAIALFLVGAQCFGQEPKGSLVNISAGAPGNPVVMFNFYLASNTTPDYICIAPSVVNSTSFTITSATAANPGVFTASGYGLFVSGARYTPTVTIAGATGSWVSANATWVLVPVSSTTFTLANQTTGTAFNTTGFGALTGTVIASTTAPRTNIGNWTIRSITLDGSSRMINAVQAFTSAGGYTRNICDDRAAAYLSWK